MNCIPAIKELITLTLREIKEKVRIIKDELPLNERKIITFSKNFTIPLSNYCTNYCSYCYFNHRMKSEENLIILLGLNTIEKLMLKANQLNCKEVLIMSGERPDKFQEVKNKLKKYEFERFLDYVLIVCKTLVKRNFLPHTNVGDLTYYELSMIKNYNASMGLMLESTNSSLSKKGMVHEKSPGKRPNKRIKFIENAGKLKIPFTTGLLLGIGESLIDRINDLFLIKELNEKYGHIQEIIIQNFIQKPNLNYLPSNPTSINEILKTVGIAKLIVENSIKIQVPPNFISGYEKEFLDMGIDDFGGISPFTRDEINPYKPWPEIDHLKKICKVSGLKLVERLPVYDKFLNKNEFLSPQIKNLIKELEKNSSYKQNLK